MRYEYDTAGRIARKTLGNGVYTTYEYDAAGQILHLVNRMPDESILSRFDYTYDIRGLRTSMGTLDGVWAYEYDALGQLTGWTSPDGRHVEYVYDAVGNRVTVTDNDVVTRYTTNNMNQYTTVDGVQYIFDADGNLVQRTDGSEVTAYVYDPENRLIAVRHGADSWEYEYDAFDRRAAVTDKGITTHYVIDPIGLGNIVGEYNGAGQLNGRYDHGLGLVSRHEFGGIAAYYTFDALGTTSETSDGAGALIDSYSHDPFGGSLTRGEDGAENKFKWNGEWGIMAGDEDLKFIRARFYDPNIGRFLSEDPIGLMSGDLNYYRYVSNSPTTFIDAVGMDEDTKDDIEKKVEGDLGALAKISGLAAWLVRKTPYGRVAGAVAAIAGGTSGIVHFFGLPPSICFVAQCGPPPCDISRVPGCKERPPAVPPPTPPWQPPRIPPRLPPAVPPMVPPVCLPAPNNVPCEGDKGQAENARPVDPNQKVGPSGFGPRNYVQADVPFPYRIDFENDSRATAPAQRVDITDKLDAGLDWATFELTEVGFGDNVFAIPNGTQYYKRTVPVELNSKQFQVEMELGLRSETGEVFAHFQSIDPTTTLPPDVMTGFLPPEDGTGRGMGYFSYLIRPKAGLPTGTELRNIALITFDRGETIATNQIDPHDPTKGTEAAKEAMNTIDAAPPLSRVDPLPGLSESSSFFVSWSGSDEIGGSGIASFDVFASTDGGPFVSWLSDTSETSATFVGQEEHTYSFFSQATDNVGQREVTPTADQAATVVQISHHQRFWTHRQTSSWSRPKGTM